MEQATTADFGAGVRDSFARRAAMRTPGADLPSVEPAPMIASMMADRARTDRAG